MKNYVLITFFLMNSFCFKGYANDNLDYFKEFIYQENIDNTDPENPTTQTRYLMSAWDKKINLENGDSLNVIVSLFLLSDQNYVAFYKENLFQKDAPGQFLPRGCRKITGKWNVPEDKLILPGLGFATKALINGQQGVLLKITEKIISSEAVSLETETSYGFSNMTLQQQFCW